MSYQPIENYGVVGNMRTVALVGVGGSIDWYCFPHFDSPSVFGALLDDKKGGRFLIASTHEDVRCKQIYWPDTNVLLTRFLCPDGVGELQDFMPVIHRDAPDSASWLIRRVRVSRGEMEFRLTCEPAFDYARAAHRVRPIEGGVEFRSEGLALELVGSVPLQPTPSAAATATFRLREGETAVFVLRPADSQNRRQPCPTHDQSSELFQTTVEYWRRWLGQCRYAGRWRDIVNRSALTLKLLTFEPTGAIVAAPTCSLPEFIGGPRNWDYRYTWIRDAAFTLYGLLRLGFTSESADFMRWLDARYREGEKEAPLQVLYRIDGSHEVDEFTLDHLDGYKGSRPVRVGNNAANQLQLDIYGELLDSVYLFNKYGSPISYEAWKHLRALLDWLCENWQSPDDGIWEVRGGTHQFVYSKLMCWVAMDRGLRLAEKRSFPADRSRWLKVRDDIYEAILAHGWSEKCGSFVQSFDECYLDASTLLMPLVFFMAPNDPKMLQTIEAIGRSPSANGGGLTSDGLVHRYDPQRSPDGIGGDEGTFNMCSFWLVEALTRAGRIDPPRLDEARLLFERMLGYANHLGLYAEETGPSGEALGNFPQAFTHLALISAAFNLDRSLDHRD